MKKILIIIFVSLFTYTLSGQSQEKDCSKRDPFETEQEFQEHCKKLSVIPAVPKSADQKFDFSVLSDLRKSPFETEEEFKKRCNQLIEYYNRAVSGHDPLYQAGVAKLDKNSYDIKTGNFPL